MEQHDQVAELTGKRSRIKRFEELMRKLLIQINKSGAHGHGEGGIDPERLNACHHAECEENQSSKKIIKVLFFLMCQLFKTALN